MARILIVDDEDSIRLALRTALSARHQVDEAADGESALVKLAQGSYDLLLTDLRMGKVDGLELLKAAKALQPPCPVIMLTAYGSVDGAVEAMKAGADEYLTKPFRLEELERRVEGLLERLRLRDERDYLRSANASDPQLLGQSPPFAELLRQIEQAAPSEASVLVLGETGTGKEGVAKRLHSLSRRSAGPFVAVNCAAFASGLIESELFGHEKGAFTGAVGTRKGRLELADGGTLFLDEVGEIPLDTQVKLLRAIEQRRFERVGGTVTLKSDFRVLSATHRDLQALVRQGRFREDLYFRLAVLPLQLPPLRERGEDVLLLAKHFLSVKARGRALDFSPAAQARLRAYRWPGNVRELQNVIERAVLLAPAGATELDAPAFFDLDPGGQAPLAVAGGKALSAQLDEAERGALAEALRQTQGNQSQAAKLLGLERTTLQYKIKKHGLGCLLLGWLALGPALARAEEPEPTPRFTGTVTMTPWTKPPQLSQSQQERLYQLGGEIERIRTRLRDEGRAESERGRPDWWDLPSRRRQGERLRNLRHLRRDLERRLEELEALRAELLEEQKSLSK